MIKRKDLEALYWGQLCMPYEWHTVGEIAKQTNLTEAYVRTALSGYGIPIRSSSEELHRVAWRILADDFGLVPNSDFFYNSKIEIYDVDFHLPHEKIGIRITDTLPVRHSDTIMFGESYLIKISSKGGEEEVERALRKALFGHKVRAQHTVEDDKEEIW